MAGHFWGIFLVIAIIVLSIGGAATFQKVMEGMKECKLNSDCPENNYCGSDFKCHSFPVIENTIVEGTDWKTPAAILGVAIIIAAMILRKKQQTQKQFY